MLPSALLTLPAANDRTFAKLDRKVRLLTLRALLQAPAVGLPPDQARALRRVQGAVSQAARSRSAAVLDALALPDVRAPLLVLRAGLRPPAPLLQAAVPALLVALAHRNALAESLLWPGPIDRIPVQDVGRVDLFTEPAEALVAGPETAEVRVAGALVVLVGPGAAAPDGTFARLGDGLHLAQFDSNPLADIEDHPDKDGNAIDLGGRAMAEWVAALQGALAGVAAALPTWAAELPLAQRRVVPVGFEPERHLSATYREAPGVCYLTLHPDPLTLAEALVHETQHSKLGIALHLDPLLRNGRSTWTASPVRPDLRPLLGVLLAVHAFVPVAALHARLLELDHPWTRAPHFPHRQRSVLAGNARGLAMVEDLGQPTALGARLVGDLRRLHDATAARVPDLEVAPDALPPG